MGTANAPLDIIYQDEHLIAINKPAGLLVHPSMIDRHERVSAMTLLRDQIGCYVYPVHRLDKPTSGILVFALSTQMAREISQQFSDNLVIKKYLAVVRGYTEASGRIDYALKEKLDKITDAKAKRDKPAQAAITDYRRLAKVELPIRVDRYPSSRYSLVEIRPLSGRKHQIRRHFKHLSHPIIGDTSYGKSNHNRSFNKEFGCNRLLLAATQLTLQHPLSGEELVLRAGLDKSFAQIEALFYGDRG